MDPLQLVKGLSYEKKLALASFAVQVAAADGEITEDEMQFIAGITLHLEIDATQEVIDKIVNNDYSRYLPQFNKDEALALGFILGVVATADGRVSFSESSQINNMLLQSGINPEFIPIILETITSYSN